MLPVPEAARMAEMSPRTIYDWIAQGKVTGRRVRKLGIYVDFDHLSARLQQCARGKRLSVLRHLPSRANVPSSSEVLGL